MRSLLIAAGLAIAASTAHAETIGDARKLYTMAVALGQRCATQSDVESGRCHQKRELVMRIAHYDIPEYQRRRLMLSCANGAERAAVCNGLLYSSVPSETPLADEEIEIYRIAQRTLDKLIETYIK